MILGCSRSYTTPQGSPMSVWLHSNVQCSDASQTFSNGRISACSLSVQSWSGKGRVVIGEQRARVHSVVSLRKAGLSGSRADHQCAGLLTNQGCESRQGLPGNP